MPSPTGASQYTVPYQLLLDNKAQVEETFARMTAKVDKQNAGDKLRTPMMGNFKGVA